MKKLKAMLAGVKESIRKMLVSLKRKPQMIALVVLALAFVYYSFNLTTISNTTAYVNLSSMGLCSFAIMLFSVLLLVCFLNAFPHRKKVNIPMLALMFVMIACVAFAGFVYSERIDESIDNLTARGAVEYLDQTVAKEEMTAIREAAAAELQAEDGAAVTATAGQIYEKAKTSGLGQDVLDGAAEAGRKAVDNVVQSRPFILEAKDVLSVHRVILLIGAALVALLPVYAPLIRKIRTSVEVEANENMGEIDISGDA